MSILKKVNENLRAKAQSGQALDLPVVSNPLGSGAPVITGVFRPYSPLPPAPVIEAEQPITAPEEESTAPKRRVGRPMKDAGRVPGERVRRGSAPAVPGVVRDKIVSFGATAHERTLLVEEALRLDMSLSALLRQAVFAGLGIEPPHPERVETHRVGPRVRTEWLDKLKNLNTLDDVGRLMKTLEALVQTEEGKERVEKALKEQVQRRKMQKAKEAKEAQEAKAKKSKNRGKT